MDCLGCHAQNPNGASNIINNIPQIAHNAGIDLAGGNFRDVFIDDSYGHNVHGFDSALIGTDVDLVNTPPGYSEHHTGRALDITTSDCEPLTEAFELTEAFTWLVTHASKYQFSLTYPRDNPYGIIYEPWHWAVRAEDLI